MSPKSNAGRPVSTHDIGVSLPANTKYLSGNLISRRLIRGFMNALIELSQVEAHSTVFEIGCGEGLILRQLQFVFAREVFLSGADLDADLLRVGQSLLESLPLSCASIYELPFDDNSFDLVISTEVLEHLEDPLHALREVCRVSKRYVLLSVPNEPIWSMANFLRGKYWNDWGNTPGHINKWPARKFISFVASEVHIVAVRRPFPWTMVLGRVD